MINIENVAQRPAKLVLDLDSPCKECEHRISKATSRIAAEFASLQAELDKTKKKLHFAANDLEMCEADRAVVLARYTEVDSENVLLRGLLNRVLIEYKACGGIMSGTNRDIAIALGASNG